ncbi:unannotated protein [freshwater metagenome]|uniref:Unannotated protein n=1 Tax=freshwater metagenome TaxID=449393 RepID=A0A6J6H2E1_9ZZZZ
MTLGAEFGDRFEKVAKPLHRHVGTGRRDEPTRYALHAWLRFEEFLIDAHGHDMQTVEGDLLVGVDVLERVLGNGDHAGHARCDAGLHLGESVPAAFGEALVGGFGVFHLESAVDGDGMVDRGEDRKTGALDAEEPVSEALVVLDEIEFVDAMTQVLPGAHAECERFGERAGHERADLESVAEGLDLRREREAHRELVVVDVEARKFDEGNPRIEHGKGLSAEYFDLVTEVDKGFGEMARVDALPADMGLSSVGQKGDAQGELAISGSGGASGRVRLGGHGGASLAVAP